MRTHQGVTLATLLLAVLMFPITLTGASIALPEIRATLHGDLASVQWVVNAYNTTFAGFMLAAGGLADIVGRRRVFAAGTAIFAVGGLLSAIAPNLLVLDVLRGLSGIGAAAAATSAVAIMASSLTGRTKAVAFSMFGTTIGFGLAFGPSVASLLMGALGWQAVFWFPAAVGVAALALVALVPESRNPDARGVDWPGTVTFTAGLLLVITGFIEGPALGWASPLVLAAFVVGVGLLVVFAVVERRVPNPMFHFDLLRTPGFLAAALAAATFVAVMVPLLVYLPSYLTEVVGQSARGAGATLILMTSPILVLPLVAGALARWSSANAVLAGALALVATGTAWLTGIGPDSTALSLAGPLLTLGAGIGLSTGLVDGMALASAGPSRAGTASGMFGTSRLAFETIGIAVVGSIIATGTHGTLEGEGYTGALRLSLWLLAGLTVVVLGAFLALTRRAVTALAAA
ncbi:MFS transporter [Actinokineospora diospyrosa]|uniref:Major Facilitator Superfamily protein n=1 Tax=Actinokineospora diospyrosa TaxID=103728 RepID=A0ABT1ICU8_9PSEU|nr:MFS transporter [Actinokineospora diospyrosa]MCP2270460.1 Major Facilitator Superfamily protein [Actinokineospora diospyrosa]